MVRRPRPPSPLPDMAGIFTCHLLFGFSISLLFKLAWFMSATSLPLGLYRHYKGRHYQLLHVARHSETEELLAVYRALYGDFGVWVRPLAMFSETVTLDGQNIPRFAYIGDKQQT